MCENGALSKIIWPKRDEVTGRGGGWKIPHSEELHNPYSFPYITRIIISRRMSRAGECDTYGGEEKRGKVTTWMTRY